MSATSVNKLTPKKTPAELLGRVELPLANGETPLARLFGLCTIEQAEEFQPERRSLRIHGHSTTIRLERAYWTVLEMLAEEEDVQLAALVTKIHDHCLTANDKNLASCLRVVCLKYINICT
ncbi:MAG: ribbon-helix-helix domain-containing protein [Rhodospirillaceae bacterium]|nr:ribbon-helix-helix domain-containing protein [Rhodospirillaceae bacterium]